MAIDANTDKAASPAASQASGGSGSRLIEEIIITAQKREENLQDVPISVQAFSAEALDARGITNAVDLQTATPGLSYTVLNSFNIIYLRGVGTDAFLPSADLSVATYVDGIYFPFSAGLAQDFGAVERVEVLKGPQGTLFGRNSTGGAISTTTRKPGRNFENSVQLSYANFDALRARLYTNVPLSDEWAFNVSMLYNLKDSYYDHPGRDLKPDLDRGARAKLRWTPNDAVDITVAGLVMRSQGSMSSLTSQIDPKPLFQALFVNYPLAPRDTRMDTPSEFDFETEVGYLDAKWNAGPIDVRLLGSTQSAHSLAYNDFDGTAYPLVSFDTRGLFADINTAEVQLISNADSWGSDWLTYIGGVYYIFSEVGFDPAVLAVGPYVLPLVSGTPLGEALDNLSADIVTPLAPISVEARGLLRTRSVAGFAQITAKMTDTVSVTLGGRYQTETRELYKASVSLADEAITAIRYPQQEADSSNFSPKVSLEYRPADDVMTYVSWSKGFKSGTYNIVAITRPPNYIVPEEVTAYEIGIKSRWLDGSLRLNGALFHNTIDNLQVQVISLFSSGATSFETAGQARTQGAEFDLTWQLLPDTLPGLVMTAAATWLDAKYTDFKSGSGYNDAGIFFGELSYLGPGQDFSGNRVTQSPEFTANLGLSHTIDLEQGSLEFAADGYYNSGLYYTAQNSPRAEQDPYVVLNARVSYFHAPWSLRLTVFGNNITSADYFLFNYETDFGTNAAYQPPATYGVRVNWEFGT